MIESVKPLDENQTLDHPDWKPASEIAKADEVYRQVLPKPAMKKITLWFALLVGVLGVRPTRAATNFVILGDDFQAKINASASGDTLVVQAGVYPGNLTFSKPVTVLRSGTNQIQFQGAVQINGAGATTFAQTEFASAVQIQATGTVSFSHSQFLAPVTSQAANLLLSWVSSSFNFTANLSVGTGTNLQAFDTTFYALSANGGKVLLKRCTITAEGEIGRAHV